MMRIVFFGSGEFGLPTLGVLRERHDVALVVTQPDRPAGRKRVLTATPVAVWAVEQGLTVIKPPKVNAPEIVEQIRAARADANVVVAFGQKIGDAVIASPRVGRVATMNLHASLLPRYRGAAPINWAIVRGEQVAGNTVFSLVDRMDAGDILGMQSTEIGRMETAGELHDRLAGMGAGLVMDVLSRLEAGTLKAVAQDESRATLAPKISREDAVVDFAGDAEDIRRRVHGFYPWPGVTVWYGAGGPGARGLDPSHPGKELRLCRVDAVEGRGEPGVMVEDGVVACGRGAVRLLEVQPAGKRVMSWEEFNRGAKLRVGEVFSGRLA